MSTVEFGTGGGTTDAGSAGFGLVEALVAFVILSVGLLAIAGLALAVGQQTRTAAWTTEQVLAGQQTLAAAAAGPYAAVTTKDTTVTVGERTFTVSRTVSQSSPGVKNVEVLVPGVAPDQADFTISTRIHAPRALPTSGP